MAEGEVEVDSKLKKKKQRGGFLSRMWSGMFGGRNEDYEKKLEYLTKEEGSVHARMKWRAQTSRRIIRNVVLLAVFLELVAVVYAIIMTRGVVLSWQERASRVLPIFVVPAFGFVVYKGLVRLRKLLDQKDQKMLERLRSERKAKIDELKERTKYYMTQQLIQKYDLDPAAKAAAATVLASKFGADSGLKVSVEDETNPITPLGRKNDIEAVHATGLRNRRPSYARSYSTGSTGVSKLTAEVFGAEGEDFPVQYQTMVEHFKGPPPKHGNILSRLVAFLVGDDPAHSYALICGNCRMHNGLARKEDFSFMTYYCPHCHALNGSRQADDASGSGSGIATPRSLGDASSACGASTVSSVAGEDLKTNLATVEEMPVDASDEKET